MTSPTGDIVVPVSTMNGMVQSPLINAEAPEMIITDAAVALAIYEKAATWFGKVAFIWATVVLLGGFVASLETVDFWFVSALLAMEGFRIIWRRIELSGMSMIKWSAHCMQVLAAFAVIVLCYYRVRSGFDDRGSDNVNPNRALKIFYVLCIIDAGLVVLEKYPWTVILLDIESYPKRDNFLGKPFWKAADFMFAFSKVKAEYSLHDSELASVGQHFFCETFSRCIGGSIKDGNRMDFVSYSMELLQSCRGNEQLMGAGLLLALAKKDRFAVKTCRIGSRQDVVERLIEMLNWENYGEQKIRRVAAEIILILVKQNRNRIRVMSIAGFMESIASLLYDIHQIEIHLQRYRNKPNDCDSSGSNEVNNQSREDYTYSKFSLLGLRILEILANDRDNCTKIGSSRGPLPKIIGLTELNPNDHDNCTKIGISRGPLPSALESQIDTANLALQLMGTLALQKKTWEIFFAMRNLRGVLWYREILRHDLQIRAIDTLTSLALEQEGREIIGGTGGVLRNLFSLFFMEGFNNNDEAKEVVTKAGKALSLLSVENKHNCEIMISIKLACRHHWNLIARLISVLHEPVQGIHVLRILRNLWAYRETAHYDELREITATATATAIATAKQVVMFVTEKQGEHQEAAIGLAAQMFKFMTKSDFDLVFEESSGVTLKSLISKLVELFRGHPHPSKEVPSIRRFSIELLIAVMEKDRSSSAIEMRSKLEEALEGKMETTTEMECYSTVSGSVGLSRDGIPVESLRHYAMELLRNL